MSGKAHVVGIDVGATKTIAVRVDADGRVLARHRQPTAHRTIEEFVAALVAALEQLGDGTVAAMGVALPGIVDASTGSLAYAPSLTFGRAPMRALLEQALDMPVLTVNDADAAAWAEYRRGAGRGHEHMLMVTGGTGLGCGAVVGGRLLRGAHGFAAEASHLILDPDGPSCECGSRGCWGKVASGATVSRLGREAAVRHPDWALAAQLAPVTGEAVTQAAHEEDPIATGILTRVGTLFGKGLAALANLLDPSILVVGGGLGDAGELLLGPARISFHSALTYHNDRPEISIVSARLGNDAGAVGAAVLAMEQFRNPHLASFDW